MLSGTISIAFLTVTFVFVIGGIPAKEYSMLIHTGVIAGLIYGVSGVGYILLVK